MPTERIYQAAECAVFRFTKGPYGALSNFAACGIPWGTRRVPSSEHCYQAMKFEFESDAWVEVIMAVWPKDAKRIASRLVAQGEGKYRREEWDLLKIDKMRRVLRWKTDQNPDLILPVLKETGNRAIVEFSNKDTFWGAKPHPRNPEVLQGINALGRLWMELREKLREEDDRWPQDADRALPRGVPGTHEPTMQELR